MFKRLTAFLLAFLMVMAVVGCNEVVPPEDSTIPSTSEEITETEKVEIPVELSAEELAEYVVIRPEKADNNSVTVIAAKKIRETLNSAFGLQISIRDDWYNKTETLPATAKEILVGTTNRVESTNAVAKIKIKDFAIAFENERIVIVGGSEDATSRAVDYFLENYASHTPASYQDPKFSFARMSE